MTIVLDSEAAIKRALAQVGKADGAGACLANVYKWFGSVQSVGRGAGDYDWAIKGWNYSDYRHEGDWNPPPGVPVYFGTKVTWRTDRNVPCGDVGLSIGGGRAIFTDGPSGNTEIMTLAARAKEIDRNYLGWTSDFLGHPVSGALSYISEATDGDKPEPPIVVVKAAPKGQPRMYTIFRDAQTNKAYLERLDNHKSVHIESGSDLKLILRFLAGDGTDKLLKAERDIVVNNYFRALD